MVFLKVGEEAVPADLGALPADFPGRQGAGEERFVGVVGELDCESARRVVEMDFRPFAVQEREFSLGVVIVHQDEELASAGRAVGDEDSLGEAHVEELVAARDRDAAGRGARRAGTGVEDPVYVPPVETFADSGGVAGDEEPGFGDVHGDDEVFEGEVEEDLGLRMLVSGVGVRV